MPATRCVKSRASRWAPAVLCAVMFMGLRSVDAASRRQQIVFTLLHAGGIDIFIATAAGEGLRNLTQRPDAYNICPAPSPDGRSVAYAAKFGERPGVYLMDADGSNVRWLGTGQPHSWSPDGSKLAISRMGAPGGVFDLYILDVRTGEARQLTNRPTHDYVPAWSRDGNFIAFHSYDGANAPVGTDVNVRIVPSEGGEVVTLTKFPGYDAGPSWSPDGTRIAFGTGRGVEGNSEIYTMNREGKDLRNITDTEVGREHQPDWSLDGARILFAGDAGAAGNADVYSMDADGGNVERLTWHPWEVFSPRWVDVRARAVNPVASSLAMWGSLRRLGRATRSSANVPWPRAGGIRPSHPGGVAR